MVNTTGLQLHYGLSHLPNSYSPTVLKLIVELIGGINFIVVQLLRILRFFKIKSLVDAKYNTYRLNIT